MYFKRWFMLFVFKLIFNIMFYLFYNGICIKQKIICEDFIYK